MVENRTRPMDIFGESDDLGKYRPSSPGSPRRYAARSVTIEMAEPSTHCGAELFAKGIYRGKWCKNGKFVLPRHHDFRPFHVNLPIRATLEIHQLRRPQTEKYVWRPPRVCPRKTSHRFSQIPGAHALHDLMPSPNLLSHVV